MARAGRRNHADWRTYTFLDIYVSGLPATITTRVVHKNFKRYGNVSKITLGETRAGGSANSATVRFKPPPEQEFWAGNRIQFRESETEPIYRQVSVRLSDKQLKNFTVQSPVRKDVPYPEETILEAEALGFGILSTPDSMTIMRTQRTDPGSKVRMVLNLYHKEIKIYFPFLLRSSKRTAIRDYRLNIALDEKFVIYQTPDEGNRMSLVFAVGSPPPYSKKLIEAIDISHVNDATLWKEDDMWARQTDIVDLKDHHDIIAHSPVSVRKNLNAINIGRWTTFRLTFNKNKIAVGEYRIMRDALRDFNVTVAEVHNFTFDSPSKPPEPVLWTSLDSFLPPQRCPGSNWLLDALAKVELSVGVRYQLEVCVSHGFLNEYNLDEQFLRELSQLSEQKAKRLLVAVALKAERYFVPSQIFDDLDFKKPVKRLRIPENCIEIHHATVTATTIYFNTPTVELTNRIIRRYRQYADRFLRVRFEDDEYRGNTKLFSSTNGKMSQVFARVRRTLLYGIVIGERKYEFLAWGNSQLREHAAYFFADLPGEITASDIRAFMGSFDHEKVIAKRAARMGQCFSTTTAIKFPLPRVGKDNLIPDIIRGKYNFTDGVGKMSALVAGMAHHQLRRTGPSPSVIQFRLGGCKGVLALDPHLAKGVDIRIRESQFKFASESNELEVIRCSEFWHAHLNRQIITVLAELGVDTQTFLKKQETVVKELDRAMVNDGAALKVLRDQVDPNLMTPLIAELVADGFRQSGDPFVMSVLRLWRAWCLTYLKEKAKLPVSRGANVLGCVDETATLRGHFDQLQPPSHSSYEEKYQALPEIFVQITNPVSGKREVIEGLCIIARNPSLHRGDIRVVKARNVLALHHLVDVVVMPQTGDRDLPSMCSGGDLDGDDYIVIWDEDLIPTEWNETPFHYNPPTPVKAEGEITVSHIVSFFVDYMENDYLGRIAHAHLGWADFHLNGLESEPCLELVQLHSMAVDYPKTGVPARMQRRLERNKWPHFMERKRDHYKSHKALGQLFDAVERVKFVPDYRAPFDSRILAAYHPSEELLQQANHLKNEYDKSIKRVMAQHQIKTEFEVWSTFVLSHSKASNDYKFHEEIGQLSRAVREQFFEAIVDIVGGRDHELLAPFAVAAYKVTHAQMVKALHDVDAGRMFAHPENMPFISFPWLLHDVLGKIATASTRLGTKPQLSSTFVDGVEITIPSGLEFDADGNVVVETIDEDLRGHTVRTDWMGQRFGDPFRDTLPDPETISHHDDLVSGASAAVASDLSSTTKASTSTPSKTSTKLDTTGSTTNGWTAAEDTKQSNPPLKSTQPDPPSHVRNGSDEYPSAIANHILSDDLRDNGSATEAVTNEDIAGISRSETLSDPAQMDEAELDKMIATMEMEDD